MMTLTMWSLSESGNLSADSVKDLFNAYSVLLKGNLLNYPVQRYIDGNVMKSLLLKNEYKPDKYGNDVSLTVQDGFVEVGDFKYKIEYTRNQKGELAIGICLDKLDEDALECVLKKFLRDYDLVTLIMDGHKVSKSMYWVIDLCYTLDNLYAWKLYLRPSGVHNEE